MPIALRALEPIRVAVYASDSDLRRWVLDELALMSPYGSLDIKPLDSLEHAAACDLLIVGIDEMTTDEVHQLRELIARHTAVIGIGSPQSLRVPLDFSCVLDVRLTSKQLKRAIRESVRGD